MTLHVEGKIDSIQVSLKHAADDDDFGSGATLELENNKNCGGFIASSSTKYCDTE